MFNQKLFPPPLQIVFLFQLSKTFNPKLAKDRNQYNNLQYWSDIFLQFFCSVLLILFRDFYQNFYENFIVKSFQLLIITFSWVENFFKNFSCLCICFSFQSVSNNIPSEEVASFITRLANRLGSHCLHRDNVECNKAMEIHLYTQITQKQS